MKSRQIHVPALAVEQSPGRKLYQFFVDGKTLDHFATVTRMRRSADKSIDGYQRPEALAHIAQIRKYIESDHPMIPNGIVIAFDRRVVFEALTTDPGTGTQTGRLTIPIVDGESGEEPVGWIVDGQQRTAAIRDADVERFPVPVTAFIADDEADQREQFILVNSSKPLPKSLIYELLPGTGGLLPTSLVRKRLSAMLLERIHWDPASPFHLRINTPTNPEGVIKDNSVLKMLDNSIIEGHLYVYRNPSDGSGDLEAMASVVNAYWEAVALVFPSAWAGNPRTSRLVHGAGIVAMGFLMDEIAAQVGITPESTLNAFVPEVAKVADRCAWTQGVWELPDGTTRRWNEFQNTSRDIHKLADHLLRVYRKR